jgi:adenosylmethionine-8-amino-7-oxononanoate aminotransferase
MTAVIRPDVLTCFHGLCGGVRAISIVLVSIRLKMVLRFCQRIVSLCLEGSVSVDVPRVQEFE